MLRWVCLHHVRLEARGVGGRRVEKEVGGKRLQKLIILGIRIVPFVRCRLALLQVALKLVFRHGVFL